MSLSVRGVSRAVLVAVTVSVVPAGTVRAQPAFDLELVNRGKPVPDARIVFLASGGKVPLGETGPDGILEIPMDLVDIGKGERVEAYEIDCGGEIVIVFVRPDERALLDDECERRKEENPACECRRLGAFLWGDDVVIDLGARTVTGRGTVSTSGPATHGWSVGFGVDYFHFDNWEDVACAGAQFCEADDHGVGPVGFVEYLFGPWKFGGEVGYATAPDVMRTFDGRTAEIETDFWNFGLYGGVRPVRWLQFDLGVSWLYNMADFTVLDELTGPFDFDREEDNVNGFGRVMLHLPLAPGWELVPGVGFSTNFEDDDADSDLLVPTFRTRFIF